MTEQQESKRQCRANTADAKQIFQELNLEHDYLFAKVMSDIDICRRVLEEILQISIREVSIPATQRTVELLNESKGIRLDVYVNDEEGSVYNIEMQRGHLRKLPKRSRYYQGAIDLDLLGKGSDYEELRKSYIIFICTGDPFQEGKYRYTFQNMCAEIPGLTLQDEAYKIFLNTKGKDGAISEELRNFLGYLEDSTDRYAQDSGSDLVRQIHNKLKQVKQHKEMEVEFMTLLEREREIRKESFEEGKEEGLEEGLERGIEGMVTSLKQYKVPSEAIKEQLMLRFHMSEEEAEKYLKKIFERA